MNHKLRFGILAHGVPFSGNTPRTSALGGSESTYVLMAEALVKRGHQVTVITFGGEEGHIYGVDYLDFNKHRDYAFGHLEYDVFIVGRDFSKLQHKVKTKLLGLWNHDVLTHPTEFLESIYATDFVFCLSEYHKQQFLSKAKQAEPIIYVTKNGLDLDLINKAQYRVARQSTLTTDVKITPVERTPYSFVYGSRPERGLVYLLHVVWPKILEEFPSAELHIAGYNIDQERLPDNVKRIHEVCDHAIKNSKNIINHGYLNKEAWYRLLWSSQTMVYPTSFREIACLASMEAQACGMDIVTTDDFALRECVYNTRNLVPDKPFDVAYLNKFLHRVRESMQQWQNPSQLREEFKAQERQWIHRTYDINEIARDWENYFYHLFTTRVTTSYHGIVQRLINNSDLLAVKYIAEHTPYIRDPEFKEETLAEVNGFLERQHQDPEKYAEYVDNDASMQEVESLPTRMLKALEFMKKYIDDEKAIVSEVQQNVHARVHAINQPTGNPFEQSHVARPAKRFSLLDIGCGGGRFLCNAVRLLGDDVEPHGVDFSHKLLERTKAVLESKGFVEAARNLQHLALEDMAMVEELRPFNKLFDLAFVGEVLEHQQDIYGMLEKIFWLMKPGGLVVFTVPSGNWESISFGEAKNEEGKEVRFHVSHFELRDIMEVFQNKAPEITFDPLSLNPQDHSLLGNWVVACRNVPGAVGRIDYERKFLTTVPYQYISACIIAKNEEDNILKMVKSIHQHVDQIILYDTGSTDKTLELVEDFPKVLPVHGYWDEDFSRARNRALEYVHPHASYVFWADCDEQLVNGAKLRKYLDTKLYNGYVILQHHMSLDSASTPDVPVRIFKNHKQFRFFGKVHEQCQQGLNDPIEPTLILPDVHIIHFGYLTESMRRAKVQQRNLKLLIEDRKENPNRKLGAILLMRDLLHMISWTQEARQNLGIDEEMLRKLYEVLRLYEEIAHEPSQYRALAWPYYQQALRILGSNNLFTPDSQLPFAVRVLLDLDNNPKKEPNEIWFKSHQDMRQWFDAKLSELKEHDYESV